MSEPDKHFSVDHEPALTGGGFQPDPAERRAAPVAASDDELATLRDSVTEEPALEHLHDPSRWERWLAEKRGQCSLSGNLAATVSVALMGGPFAVIGAFVAFRPGPGPVLYIILFAPVVEELLKQSGMTYLLERRPYRVFAAWQFLVAGIVSGLIFAAVENEVYLKLHGRTMNADSLARLATFRWTVCTTMHVVCAAIASQGLIRAWRISVREGRPAQLVDAFWWFVVAMGIHGIYNTWAMLFAPEF